MDPQKLAAFAKGNPNQQGGPHPKGKGNQPPAQKPGQQQKPGGNQGGGDHSHEGEDDGEDDESQEGGEGRFGVFIPALEQNASQIEELTDEIDATALTDFETDLEGDDADALSDGLNRLPPEFVAAFGEAVGDADSLTEDEARGLATHLGDEDIVSDPDEFAGWLYHASKNV